MSWKPDKDKPICPQLCEYICLSIATGVYGAGDKLPSVREMAVTAGINPNTVKRAYEILEFRGIVTSVRNQGTFVGENTLIAKESLENMRRQKTAEYFNDMKALGLDAEAIKKYIEEWNA